VNNSSGAITPATLSVSGITAISKAYDGTTAAALDTAGARLVGVLSGDGVTLDTDAATGTFASAQVGGEITVTIAGLTIVGPDSSDYTLTQPTTTASITAAQPSLNVSAPGGTYDGSPFAATVTVGGAGTDNTTAASLEDVAPTLTYYAGTGTSGADLGSAPPSEPGTYTVVAAFPGSDDYAAAQSAPVTFTIDPGTATLALSASAGSAAYGQSVSFTATVGGGATGGTVTFFDDGTSLGSVALSGSGTAVLSTSALGIGSQSITATYGGDGGFQPATSGPVAVSVAPAATEIALVPHAVLKKRKVISLGLEARIDPLAPGAGVPTGTVTFEVRKTRKKEVILGTMALGGGEATLAVKSASVLKKPITIVYGGDADFQASTVNLTLTPASLTTMARPLASFPGRR
jgi:hypothetical protein